MNLIIKKVLNRDSQINANSWWKIIEWIPYDRFKDIKEIAKGGFGTIYYAKWISGNIKEWDIKSQQWSIWYPETNKYMMVLNYLSDILHQDFHPGNILLNNFKDFGLSKIVEQNLENSNNRNIFGVLPYIAPERSSSTNMQWIAPKIPFHTPILITRIIMRCWDARITHQRIV
ncbi:hypothetical protein Glove_642g35 [Diversispora epigaea]|uniref:Protein kinase domain-containing protein n=1 Tax=Diversispora epigaea TaxID=1348612 RepID=A0A397G4H1_9GLOM|nr:hypothetical protein Glove_642g35 [Diversispora epigaea]